MFDPYKPPQAIQPELMFPQIDYFDATGATFTNVGGDQTTINNNYPRSPCMFNRSASNQREVVLTALL